MGSKRDSADILDSGSLKRDLVARADQLPAEPEDQKHKGRDPEKDRPKDQQREHVDVRAREQKQVSAHNPGDRAGRSDNRERGGGIKIGMRQSRADSAEQIKKREANFSHRAFNVVAEDPKRPHI